MQRDLEAIVDGGIGGAAATVVMSGAMAAAKRAGLLGEHPPKLISRQALNAAGIGNGSEEAENTLAVVAHLGFGSIAGSLFALLHRRLHLPVNPAVHGVVFASVLWVTSYKGWLPALGTMPAPEHDRPGRPATMVVSHWVYGATLGAIMSRRLSARLAR